MDIHLRLSMLNEDVEKLVRENVENVGEKGKWSKSLIDCLHGYGSKKVKT